MDSSWIKRWHRKDELEYSKGTTTEVSTVHEECQNLVAEVQERNLYLQCLEEKEIHDKVVSNDESFIEKKNTEIHFDDIQHGGHKNKETFSCDLQEENRKNAITRHRMNLTLGGASYGTTIQEEERSIRPQEEVFKLVSDKPPLPPHRNKSGLPPKFIPGQKAFAENLSCDFPVTDLQLNLAPPAIQHPVTQESTIKTLNIKTGKETLKLGSSHTSKIDDTSSSISSLPWGIFTEAGGPSGRVKNHIMDMYTQAHERLTNQSVSQVVNKVPTKEIDRSLKLTLQTGAIAPYNVQQESQFFQLPNKLAENPQIECSSGDLAIVLGQRNSYHGHLHERGIDNIHLIRGKQCHLHEEAPNHLNFPLRNNTYGSTLRMEQQEVLNSRNGNLGQRQHEQVLDGISQIQNEKVNMEGNEVNFALHNQKLKSKTKVNPLSGGLSQVVVSSEKSSHKQEVVSSLGKRPHKNLDGNVFKSKTLEKETNMKTSSTSHIWIQRWHPNTTDNDTKTVMSDASVLSVRQNPTSSTSVSTYSSFGMKKFKDSDSYGLFRHRSREVKSKNTDVKGQHVESSHAIYTKSLPSPAAMAIVGTAARQFCTSHPHRMGSFAFWSGFGMSSPQKVELRQGGKSKSIS